MEPLDANVVEIARLQRELARLRGEHDWELKLRDDKLNELVAENAKLQAVPDEETFNKIVPAQILDPRFLNHGPDLDFWVICLFPSLIGQISSTLLDL